MSAQEKLSHAGSEAKFDWADPLFLNQSLSQDEVLIRGSVRGFAAQTLMPIVRDAHASVQLR